MNRLTVLWVTSALLLAVQTLAQPTCPPSHVCRCDSRIVWCQNLSLTSLPPNTGDDTTIGLHFIGNPIKRLTSGMFSYLTNLQVLDLSNNQIQFIAADAFEGLNKLVRLFLDLNQITTILDETFRRLPKLSYLDLKNNKLTTLSENVFKYWTNDKKVVRLYDNPWVCNCSLVPVWMWMKNVLANDYYDRLTLCSSPDWLAGKRWTELNVTALCWTPEPATDWLMIAIIALIILVFVIGAIFLVYYFLFRNPNDQSTGGAGESSNGSGGEEKPWTELNETSFCMKEPTVRKTSTTKTIITTSTTNGITTSTTTFKTVEKEVTSKEATAKDDDTVSSSTATESNSPD